jgi:hypothetical protein
MKTVIIVFGRFRQERDFAHVKYEPGRVFIETKTTHGAEFEAMLHCVHHGVIVGVLKMADLGRGMGQVNAVKAITDRGGVVQVFEPVAGSVPKPSKDGKLVLTDQQRDAACAIWANSAITEASRLHRINAIDGMPKLEKHQIVYQCVTKPKRQQK